MRNVRLLWVEVVWGGALRRRRRGREKRVTAFDRTCDGILACAMPLGALALLGHYTAPAGYLEGNWLNCAWMAVILGITCRN